MAMLSGIAYLCHTFYTTSYREHTRSQKFLINALAVLAESNDAMMESSTKDLAGTYMHAKTIKVQ